MTVPLDSSEGGLVILHITMLKARPSITYLTGPMPLGFLKF